MSQWLDKMWLIISSQKKNNNNKLDMRNAKYSKNTMYFTETK